MQRADQCRQLFFGHVLKFVDEEDERDVSFARGLPGRLEQVSEVVFEIARVGKARFAKEASADQVREALDGLAAGLAARRAKAGLIAAKDRRAADKVLAEGQALEGTAGVGAFVAYATLVMVSFFRKSERLKVVTLVASVLYLGFYKGTLMSIVDIFRLINWNVPIVRENLAWYAFAIFFIVIMLLWGRLYCGRVCAFGSLTQLMDKIVPAKWRITNIKPLT